MCIYKIICEVVCSQQPYLYDRNFEASYREVISPDLRKWTDFLDILSGSPAGAPENEAAQYTRTKMLKPKAIAILSTLPVPRKQVP